MIKMKLEDKIEIGILTTIFIAGSALLGSLISEYSHSQRDNKKSSKVVNAVVPKKSDSKLVNAVVSKQSEDETSAAGLGVYRKQDGDFEAGYGGKGAGVYYSQDEGIDIGFGL